MALVSTTDEIKNVVEAFSEQIVKFKKEVEATVRNHFPEFASDENVKIIGRNRNLPILPNEDKDLYRDRVTNAFEENQGQGNVGSVLDPGDIILIMKSLGFKFDFLTGFVSGFLATSSPKDFNLLAITTGATAYDGAFDYDATILYDSPGPNDINIEIAKNISGGLNFVEQDIRDALGPVLRASSRIANIINVNIPGSP